MCTLHVDTRPFTEQCMYQQSSICPTCLERSAYTGSWQCATMVPQLRGKSFIDLYKNACGLWYKINRFILYSQCIAELQR